MVLQKFIPHVFKLLHVIKKIKKIKKLSRRYYISLWRSCHLFKPHFKMYEMREQTTNLNVDDFCALRCFDSNKSISHITWDNQGNMKCCAGGWRRSGSFWGGKVERNQQRMTAGSSEWSLTPTMAVKGKKNAFSLSIFKDWLRHTCPNQKLPGEPICFCVVTSCTLHVRLAALNCYKICRAEMIGN